MTRATTTVVGTAALAAALLAGCRSTPDMTSSITEAPFGEVDGREVSLFTLTNDRGSTATITNYGGIVTSLRVPDRDGRLGDVVLGYDTLDGYLTSSPYFGCITGRYCNRIAKGRFELDGKAYQLATNNGPNHLHGGVKGFDKRVWEPRAFVTPEGPSLELTYSSPDGEEGYPGTLDVVAVYTLTNDGALRVDFSAATDAPTVCNLTHHSYFNLRGRGDVLDHVLSIPANRFVPVDDTGIPTGELAPVDDTPFDFRRPTRIGERIDAESEQIRNGAGYDHNWVVAGATGNFRLHATVRDPESGRVMMVFSSEPGLQFYTGNFLDGSITGKGGRTYERRDAFCLEPQRFPDSPNHPDFPSATLRPGETYRHTIEYRFGTTEE
ncbi:MAG: aldose epimerase family protein [Planctomycetota bacterium]